MSGPASDLCSGVCHARRPLRGRRPQGVRGDPRRLDPRQRARPLGAGAARRAGLRLIRVCREGEAFAVAAGLHLGGRRPIVIIQCTGLFEAGDSLRNLIHDLKLPLFFIVGVRSYYAHQQGTTADTCPVFTEPILRAWQMPYVLLSKDHRGRRPGGGLPAGAGAEKRPGAVLVRGVNAHDDAAEALEVLAAHRGDRIVVTTMSAAGIWPQLFRHAARLRLHPVVDGPGAGTGPGSGAGPAGARRHRGQRRRLHADEPRQSS